MLRGLSGLNITRVRTDNTGKHGDTVDQQLRMLLVIPSTIDVESDRYYHIEDDGKATRRLTVRIGS